jgi:ribosome-associated protein
LNAIQPLSPEKNSAASRISIPEDEIEITAIRAQGAGGQNVNKVSSAIHLRLDLKTSSLPDIYRQRLLNLRDHRITREGVIVIKAQQYRSQEKNRVEALRRLHELVQSVAETPKERKPTKRTRLSQRRRLDSKTQRGQLKISRKKWTGKSLPTE